MTPWSPPGGPKQKFFFWKNSTEYFVLEKINRTIIKIIVSELHIVKILIPKLSNLGPLWVMAGLAYNPPCPAGRRYFFPNCLIYRRRGQNLYTICSIRLIDQFYEKKYNNNQLVFKIKVNFLITKVMQAPGRRDLGQGCVCISGKLRQSYREKLPKSSLPIQTHPWPRSRRQEPASPDLVSKFAFILKTTR